MGWKAVLIAGLTGHEQFYLEGVPVQTRAFVAIRNVRKAVSGFDVEFLVDFHGVQTA